MVIIRIFALLLGMLCGVIGTKFEKRPKPEKSKGPLDLILFVRMDLKMQKGKIGAQCAHAVLGTLKKSRVGWTKQIKVYQVESEQQLFDIYRRCRQENLTSTCVRDAGRTQIARGTYTVVGALCPLNFEHNFKAL